MHVVQVTRLISFPANPILTMKLPATPSAFSTMLHTGLLLLLAISAPSIAHAATYQNPVINDTLADPCIVYHNDMFYLYATGDSSSYRVYTSTDMVNWTRGNKVFEPGDPNVWAPDIYYHPDNGKFYIYDSSDFVVGVAEGNAPDGTFTRVTQLAWSAIDAHMYRDDDGQLYLYYTVLPSFTIYVQKMSDPVTKEGDPVALISPELPWETDGGRITEGPFIIKHDDVYYMTYSGAPANSPQYSIGYATADNPMGPFTKYENNPIMTQGNGIYGPGHNSIITLPSGEIWMVYHQKQKEIIEYNRRIYIDRITFDAQGVMHCTPTRGTDQTAPVILPTNVVVITPDDATTEIGNTQQFSATAMGADGQALNPQPTITWSVDGGGTVNSTGLFTATTAGGPFTLTASGAGLTGTAEITVPAPQGTGTGITREWWMDVTGNNITDLTTLADYPTSPWGTETLTTQATTPTNFADNYGQRLTGYFLAPITGDYHFYIAASNTAELWLSTDDTPSNKQQIATVTTPTAAQQWDLSTSQKSSPITLQAGQRYYLETLHKAGAGDDHLALGVELPGAIMERPIPAERLDPFITTPTNPGYLDLTTPTLEVSEGAGTATIQVTRNGGTQGTLTATYGTSDGTATSGIDYSATSGTLQWNDGDSSPKTISITLLEDTTSEVNETFQLTLTSQNATRITQPLTATVTIADNESQTAALLAYEGFDYTSGTAIHTLTATGTGWNGNYGQLNRSTTGRTATSTLAYTGIADTGVSWESDSGFCGTSRPLAQAYGIVSGTPTHSTLWVSWIIQLDYDLTTTSCGQSLDLMDGAMNRISFGRRWGQANWSGTTNFGAGDSYPTSSVALAQGQNALMVMRLDFNGSGSNNVTAWINPDLTQGEPQAAQAAWSQSAVADWKFDTIQLLHTGNADTNSSQTAGAVKIDDFRIAESWDKLWGLSTATGYSAWMSNYPTITGNDALPNADADNDGLDNFTEYSLGSNPQQNDSSQTAPTLTDSGTNLQFTFKRERSTVSYVVEKKTALDSSTWSTFLTNPGNAGELVTVNIPKSEMVNNKVFIRLKMTE